MVGHFKREHTLRWTGNQAYQQTKVVVLVGRGGYGNNKGRSLGRWGGN